MTWRRRLAEQAPLAPLTAAAVFVVVVAWHLRRLVVAIFWNSDIASLPLIAGDLGHRAGGVAKVSIASYYSTFLFDLLTRWVPAHRGLWEVLSLALSLAGCLLVAVAARRAMGKAAALVTGAMALAAAPIAFYGAFELRGPTWVTEGLVAVLVVVAAEWRLPPLVLAVAGVFVGVNLASDPLVAAAVLAPLAIAGVALWALQRSPPAARLVRAAAVVCAAALVGAAATYGLARSLGFRLVSGSPKLGLASPSRMGQNLRLFGHGIGALGNEEFPHLAKVVSAGGVLTLGLVVLAAGAAAWGLADVLRRGANGSPGRAAFLLYWVATVVVVSVAFVVTTLPEADVTSARYLVPVFFAAASLIGVLAAEAGWRRIVASLAATAFCIASTVGFLHLVTYTEYYPLAAEGPGLITWLHDHGLSRGYAAYWDALGLSWRAGGGLQVTPVEECAGGLCPYPENVITTWYRPMAGERTFVVVGLPILPMALSNPLPASLGTPQEVDHLGIFTIYLYGDDVAARLGPRTG